jgi:hypothetical protein
MGQEACANELTAAKLDAASKAAEKIVLDSVMGSIPIGFIFTTK